VQLSRGAGVGTADDVRVVRHHHPRGASQPARPPALTPARVQRTGRLRHQGGPMSGRGGGLAPRADVRLPAYSILNRANTRMKHAGGGGGARQPSSALDRCRAGAMGRRQCELEGCSKAAATGGTQHCVAHGGGKRCQHAGCSKSARGDTEHCIAHGGGGGASTRAAPRLLETIQSTSDELTVLYSNGPDDRSVKLAHATLRGAWWRQALSEGGLRQGSLLRPRQCCRTARSLNYRAGRQRRLA
jgi:hypothetical protein